MENKDLKIEQEKNGDVLVCKLSGWLDPNTSPTLLAELDLDDVNSLIFDLQNVEYVFSAGLRAMLVFQRILEEKNGSIKLINVPDAIRFIFEDTGLESMLERKV